MMPSVLGYLDRLSARAGETLTLRVSVLDPARRYRAELVRLLNGDAGPKGPSPREEAVACGITGEHEGIEQTTNCGSYAVVDDLPPIGAFDLDLLACPTLPGVGVQTLAALGPVRLILDESGAAAAAVGDARVSTGVTLRAKQWVRIEASYDPATGATRVASTPFPGFHADRRAERHGEVAPGLRAEGPLFFAAEPMAEGRTRNHFSGKLEATESDGRCPRSQMGLLARHRHHHPLRSIAAWSSRPDRERTKARRRRVGMGRVGP